MNQIRALVACILTACGPSGRADVAGRRPGHETGPSLVPLDSIRLAESDSNFLGRVVYNLAVDDSGRLYVPATAFARVARFGPDGVFQRSYERPSSGPNEISDVGPAVAVGADLLVVSASRSYRLSVFRQSTGELLASTPYLGFIGSAVIDNDEVWFGNFSRRDNRVLGVAQVDSLVARGASATRLLTPRWAAVPDEFAQLYELDMASEVRVAPIMATNRILVGFQPLDWLVVVDPTNGATDTVEVPVRLRRGASGAKLKKQFTKGSFRYDRAMNSVSFLEALGVLSGGRGALVHFDPTVEMKGRDLRRISASAYLSLLSSDLSRSCVDGRIPISPDVRPVVAFHGDTLYVLEQRVAGLPPTPATIVTRYLVSDSGCTWVGTRTPATSLLSAGQPRVSVSGHQ